VGEEATGRVTGIAPHGLYITLDPWYVEGLVHVSRLPGYFTPDAMGFALVSHETGLRFGLGDRLLVKISRADPIEGRIDFDLVERLNAESD
jgi:ribonuclease R